MSTFENGDVQEARYNAPFTSSIPVYNTAGQLVADAATPLYNESLTIINPIGYDQFGNPLATYVWSGSNCDGTFWNPLGNGNVYGPPDIGISSYNSGWLGNVGNDIATNVHPLYALSSPITVPEPGTLALFAAGLLAGVVYLRRRVAKASILIVFIVLSFVALPAHAGFIPPNLPAGSEYEIAFVTSGGTTATDPYDSDYNAFVTAQAAQNPNLPQGVTWHAIANTFENGDQQDVRQNAPFTSSIPVYNTAGQLVANAATPLYNYYGGILNPIGYDQFGNADSTYVWTGSGGDGTYDNPLGNGNVYGPPDLGLSTISYYGWLGQASYAAPTNVYPLYALSSPVTVPEPSTIALLLTGLLAGVVCLRRRIASTVRFLLAFIALWFVALPAHADFIPPNLPAGSEYEIAFVTSGGTTATGGYITDYNTFVIAQAQENPNLPQGGNITWHAMASTLWDGATPRDNAPFTSSIPVFNTHGQLIANGAPVYNAQGQLIASAATPLYSESGNIVNPIGYDQFGNPDSTLVWTGCDGDGTNDDPLGGQPYGLGQPDLGYSGINYYGWVGQYDFANETNSYPLYALSSPITVPEPSTIGLLLTGLLAGVVHVRRRLVSSIRPLFVFAALLALAPLSAYAGFIPPNLPAGSKYEIAFVTSGGTTATDPYEADYNAFVTAQANENPGLPQQGETWHAIASTYENGNEQAAIQNAPFTSSIPVYNTQGQLVANAATPLYSVFGNIINPILYDQFGNPNSTLVWTGSGYDGTGDDPLGGQPYAEGEPDLGYSNTTQEGWLGQYGYANETNVYPLYALSSPITVPEPSTLALLAAGTVGVVCCWRRGRIACLAVRCDGSAQGDDPGILLFSSQSSYCDARFHEVRS